MDHSDGRCYQPSQSFNGTSFDGTNEAVDDLRRHDQLPRRRPTGRDGVLKGYGFVYRLLQNNVPVYYILNTTKTAVDASTSPSPARPARRSRWSIHSGSTSTYGNTKSS